MGPEHDRLVFREDAEPRASAGASWRILVVDDDREVHDATDFALRDLTVNGLGFELLHAFSSKEALATLAREADIAVVLLDVVMETPTAGLDIIARIRGELGLRKLRIILRTGQPGYAPELETIRKYEINDYKAKSELTQGKLYAALAVAIRTYEQLRREARHGLDLERIIESGRRFKTMPAPEAPAETLLRELVAYLDVPPDGLLAAQGDGSAWTVMAASGVFSDLRGGDLDTRLHPYELGLMAACAGSQRSTLGGNGVAVHITSAVGPSLAGFVGLPAAQAKDIELPMLDVFCAHLSLEWQNLALLDGLREAAFKDPLTGLFNRLALIERLDQCRVDADCSARSALALIDIDQFAGINDMFGHSYGDELLRRIARRLEEGCPPRSVIARVGSDTFAVWGEEGAIRPELLRRQFTGKFSVDGVEHSVTVSIGIVRLREADALTGADLIKEAWIALKRAKMNGHGQDAYYSASSARETHEHTRLLHALRQAFHSERLFLMYQPQFSLESGEVIGLEALLRWKADDGRFIAPDRFIPIAESSGLIIELGSWVLRSALRAMRQIADRGYTGIRMAVNVSSQQFGHPGFLDDLDAGLAEVPLAPEMLELEITESVAIMGAQRVEETLLQLRERGITVAIDDFGTGYSSLSYLDRLPVDRIKIDRSFVQVANTPGRGARIAEMVIPLGIQLGLQVLAEGVETEAQAEFLRRLGCHEAQGYLYARPMPLDELLPWLHERNGTKVSS